MRSIGVFWALIFVLAAVPGVFNSSVAMADDYYCDGYEYEGNFDNVIVPDGAACIMEDVRIYGNVMVQKNASFKAISARIDGNVQAYGVKK